MSKRPAFQFYTGDWQKNAKLRRCSPAARGVWIDILCLMHDSDEYGVLRWPLKDIANAAGASMALVRELVAKGVLKGADRDAEAYVYRPKHAGKEGDPVVLAAPFAGPLWYCSRFVRDEYVRQKRGESTRFDAANQPTGRSPKGGIGERQGDGPSTSSSPSGSEPIGSGVPPVDNPEAQADAKRKLWVDAGTWLTANGMDVGEAKEFINTLAKDYPAVVADALREAMKEKAPALVRPWTLGVAKRLDAARRAEGKTVPSDADQRTAAYLAEQSAHVAAAVPPPANLAELRQRIASKGLAA